MLSMLIRRCLCFGVEILPFQLKTVLEKYDKYKIPDDILGTLSAEAVKKYVEALYLSGQYGAGDWTRGFEMLEELGFEKKERSEGHRVFATLEPPKPQ